MHLKLLFLIQCIVNLSFAEAQSNSNYKLVWASNGTLLSKWSSSLVNKDESGFNPFKQPHYVLLNLAIGGANGGNPSHTSFPKKFEIDYVRVYQKE